MVEDTIPSMIEEYTDYWDQIVGTKEMLEELMSELDEVNELLEDAEAAEESNANVETKEMPVTKDEVEVKEAAAAAVAVAATENANPEMDEQIQRLFLRYDLDGSGTINSFDELEQLCCNLGYRLELELNPKQIDTIIGKVKEEN